MPFCATPACSMYSLPIRQKAWESLSALRKERDEAVADARTQRILREDAGILAALANGATNGERATGAPEAPKACKPGCTRGGTHTGPCEMHLHCGCVPPATCSACCAFPAAPPVAEAEALLVAYGRASENWGFTSDAARDAFDAVLARMTPVSPGRPWPTAEELWAEIESMPSVIERGISITIDDVRSALARLAGGGK